MSKIDFEDVKQMLADACWIDRYRMLCLQASGLRDAAENDDRGLVLSLMEAWRDTQNELTGFKAQHSKALKSMIEASGVAWPKRLSFALGQIKRSFEQELQQEIAICELKGCEFFGKARACDSDVCEIDYSNKLFEVREFVFTSVAVANFSRSVMEGEHEQIKSMLS